MNEEKIGMYTKDEILEYMTDCEGAFLGRSMYDDIFGKIDDLQQQLKDKDEKISKVKELLKNPSTIDYEMYGLECSRDIVDIKLLLEILESNKED